MNDHVKRAELARQVVENPIFCEALDAMKCALDEKWLGTADLDVEIRERAWRHRKFLQVFEEVLRGYIEHGTMRSEPTIDRP